MPSKKAIIGGTRRRGKTRSGPSVLNWDAATQDGRPVDTQIVNVITDAGFVIGPGLIEGRVPFVDSTGGLIDSAYLTYDDTLHALTIGEIPFISPGFASVFIGIAAGLGAEPVSDSILIGHSAGDSITAGATGMIAIGPFAGYRAYQAGGALLFGPSAGFGAENATNMLALGNSAGKGATNAATSILIGGEAGRNAVTAAKVIFIGTRAGKNDTINIDPDADGFGILIGNDTSTGGWENSIAIGQGASNSASLQANLANVLYLLNIATNTSPDATPVAGGLVGIGKEIPADILDIAWDHDGQTAVVVRNTDSGASAYAGLVLFSDTAQGGVFADSSNSPAYGAIPFGTSTGFYSVGGPFVLINDDGPLIFGCGPAPAPEVMRIDVNGNLGIGTPSPAFSLDILRDQNASTNINVTNPNNGASAQAGISCNGGSGTSMGFFATGSGSGAYGGFPAGAISGIYATGGPSVWGNDFAGPLIFATGASPPPEVARFDTAGRLGLGTTAPSAFLHLLPGTAAAGTAPQKFTSGALLTSPEVGAVEFLADKLYATITTGATRKEITLNDAALTSGKVPVATTNGRLADSGLTATKVSRPLFSHTANAGNATTTLTDLYSDTIAAGQLAADTDEIDAEYAGVFVSSATATREVTVAFGGTTIFDTGLLTLSLSSAWTIYASVIRVSATVVRYMVTLATQGAALSAYTAVGEVTGLTLSATNVLKVTGQAAGVGAASNDIVAKMGSVTYRPGA